MKNNFVNEGSLCNFCVPGKKKGTWCFIIIRLLSGHYQVTRRFVAEMKNVGHMWKILCADRTSSAIHCSSESGWLLFVTQPSLHLSEAWQIMVGFV